MAVVTNESYEIGREIVEHVKRTVPGIDGAVVSWFHFPDPAFIQRSCQRSKFAAIELSNGDIGIAYAAYVPDGDPAASIATENRLLGTPALDLVDWLGKPDALPAQRAIAMAVVNALSTGHVKAKGLLSRLDFMDAVDAMDIISTDIVGMVGMFPPLVQPVAKKAAFLHVIELKPDLVQVHDGWDVTLDPSRLGSCNKIMVTGTVLLNGTLQAMVELAKHAELLALIGPTASFLPDSLFSAGFDIVAGSIVVDPEGFKARVSHGEPWGVTTRKFVARKDRWTATRQ